ncbi:hypothetical protein PF005_g20126 [Phytophthora fragariae]|uniref:Uncharacterized protein n=1 Tax=Phytophthora fragariae TaxID=53985 RepID=A0A6A3WRX1_9STRA|nr:hypothetical protein PF003_g812 [Phytophthora fragariae]KAE8937891.1 hypothetical protein PF009_g12214 [Phytophthora fragariae]KAE8991633.1 hypothetical protein PF011_g17874 [Phytophthora fragariae]KAE9090513.1 hypothetical protein PF007_g19211 [Phytophthora fragariae]KAE9124696.1 hypothetical protein PF006_g17137 [Phytophthora fragariae]
MPPTYEVRAASKTVSQSKKDSSTSNRVATTQAGQASPDSRRKCDLCVAVAGARSRNAASPTGTTRSRLLSRADLTICSGNDSDGDVSSLESSRNKTTVDESVSDIVNKPNVIHEHLTGTSCKPVVAVKEEPSNLFIKLNSSTVSTSTGLSKIQQSIQRLRSQRTLVERLSDHNDELERQLVQQKAEKDSLQQEVFTLRGMEQENTAYPQNINLLQQRTCDLEEACKEKTMQLKTVLEKLSCVEQERDQLRQKVENARKEHQEHATTLKGKEKRLLQRIEQLERVHEAQSDGQKCMEHHWKQKMINAARANSQTIDALQQQLEQSCSKTKKLEAEVQELQEQVQNLLATTVRQTTVIEECDRVLSETKAQQQRAERKYEEQLQISCELSAKSERLEVQVDSLPVELEKEVASLKSELTKYKDALRDKDKELESIQHAYIAKEDECLHVGEVTKGLQRNEKRWKSDISELQIALRDAKDEINLLSEQIAVLQEQMDSERKDRSRWATARLKLLAEFCDEESMLGSTRKPHGVSLDDQQLALIEKQPFVAPQRRKAKSFKRATSSHVTDDQSYDGDDSDEDIEQTRSSIVFG